jgi:hypothetical protein
VACTAPAVSFVSFKEIYMGLVFLIVVGVGIGATSLYWAHGSDIKEGVFARLITNIQKSMDERAKDRK